MRLIILRGPGHRGKSTTINMVYDELVNSRYVESISEREEIGSEENNDFATEIVLTD